MLPFLLFLFAPLTPLSAYGGGLFGGGMCGCAPPPMPVCPPQLPPIPCPPPPPPCPPCPPTFCPPPVMCPPAPPPCPLPPPPCPPPSPPCQCGGGGPIGFGGGAYPTAGVGLGVGFNGGGGGVGLFSGFYPSNDCCCSCGSPCRFVGRARTHGARIFAAPTSEEQEEDPHCNSPKLRSVIEQNIGDDPSTSKRAIQKAAEEKLFSKINVICANGDFSYVAYTDTYCQASSANVTCYAFLPLLGAPSRTED